MPAFAPHSRRLVDTAAALEALGNIVFRPYARPDDVWRDDGVHVEGLHAAAFSEIIHLHRQLKAGSEVANVVIEGRPGVGKTHFLGRLRAHVLGHVDLFVLVQLSSARQFWQSLVVQYVSAFSRPSRKVQTQLEVWSAAFFRSAGIDQEICKRAARSMIGAAEIASLRPALRKYLGRTPEARTAVDVAIALLLQASEDFEAQDVGMAILQGLDIEPECKQRYGFQSLLPSAREVIGAFDKLVATAGMVSVVCVDQLDGLISITQQEGDDAPADGQFLDEIANGLMDLAQDCSNSLIAISCLRQTWERIKTKAVQSAASRFPIVLRFEPIPSPEVGESLIEAYFKRGYGRAGFEPPYPTWPIRASAFRNAQDYTPRRLIELAEAHVRKCRQSGVVEELDAFPGADDVGAPKQNPETSAPSASGPSPDAKAIFETFDAEFEMARKAAKIDEALTEKQVDKKLPTLLQVGLAAWIDENCSCGSFSVDGLPGPNPPLHARLRKVLDLDTEEEAHRSIRAILNAHHISALNRLRQAITASGLGLARGKRNLIILRNSSWANGEVTQRVLSEFTKLGGAVQKLEAGDLAVFDALNVLRQRHGEAIKPWLQSRRPAGSTRLLSAMLSDLGGAAPPPQPQPPSSPTNSEGAKRGHGSTKTAEAAGLASASAQKPANPTISLGFCPETNKPIDIKLEDLRRHIAIFAGSGSGKTVLIRRVIEECALAGVSSIVLDPNNDLARLGMAWPQAPSGWRPGDEELANRYLEQTEVVVWTPRRTAGRPLSFQPIGDLSAVTDDPDDFATAIDNAVATLLPRAGLPKSGAKADQGQAVLREFLRQFVRDGGSGLKEFLGYLGSLPSDVSSIAGAGKIAHGMAQTLIAATVNDPLFGGEGEPVDPGELLTPSPGKAARVSVISLVGLPNDDQRQSFVNQLQMALFAWAKKNPAGDRPLGGLYVMDEAQTFAPSSPATACTQSTLALAAQARKYGLGLVFATQAPKGIHNRIVGNATTQLYGFMNASAQITAIRSIAAMKGGDVPDISRLKTGVFYIASDAIALQKITTPNCLSYHPRSPLTPTEVLNLASPH